MQEGKTIGLIVPSGDVNIEAFYHRFVPKEIMVATNRISMDGLHLKSLEKLVLSSEQAAVDLCPVEPDILISSSLTLGCFLDVTLPRCIAQRTGVPCITPLQVLLELLDHVSNCRLAVLMPYQEDINRLFLKTLEQHAVEVCHVEHPNVPAGGCKTIREIEMLDVQKLTDHIDQSALRASGANLLLIGASGLGGLDGISEAEAKLGLPILLPEQLTLLYALAYLECYAPIPELGTVLATREHIFSIGSVLDNVW